MNIHFINLWGYKEFALIEVNVDFGYENFFRFILFNVGFVICWGDE